MRPDKSNEDEVFPPIGYVKIFEFNKLKAKLRQAELDIGTRKLRLNTDDPYNYVLTNIKGDTFTFNPQSGFGEELNDFLSGYFNP